MFEVEHLRHCKWILKVNIEHLGNQSDNALEKHYFSVQRPHETTVQIVPVSNCFGQNWTHAVLEKTRYPIALWESTKYMWNPGYPQLTALYPKTRGGFSGPSPTLQSSVWAPALLSWPLSTTGSPVLKRIKSPGPQLNMKGRSSGKGEKTLISKML